MSTLPKRSFITEEEYLAIERKAEFKSEYFQGEMFAMAGALKPHNLIASNVIRVLGNQLLERDCNVYPSDMRVKIKKIGKYTYPDVAVTCGKEIFEDDYVDTLLNPIVIFEILSHSTEARDRGEKFQHYQFIESLMEYILIAQDTVRVEQYVRQNDRTWMYSQYQNLEDLVKLESINCELSLKEVYVKVPDVAAQKPAG
jgi:Uma2 family endonuclease